VTHLGARHRGQHTFQRCITTDGEGEFKGGAMLLYSLDIFKKKNSSPSMLRMGKEGQLLGRVSPILKRTARHQHYS